MNKTMNEIVNECNHISANVKCTTCSHICYGGYCKKHKDLFLLKDGFINIDNFTGDVKDYKLNDLKKYCNKYISKSPSKFKKQDYFNKLFEHHKKNLSYKDQINHVITIQKYYRRWSLNHNVELRGKAYLNPKICNNDEDFYSYEPVEEIPPLYFFSYKDEQSVYWGFDIRSLKKLIEMRYDNPYTTKPIPDEVKSNAMVLVNKLNQEQVTTNIDNTIVADRKSLVKQRFVDIFAQMEYTGYSCDVKWILDLNSIRLKRLYRELEDTWNYRANLAQSVKCSIIPPDGRLCVMPVHDYNNCNNRVELQEILANELYKICGATTQANMQLGFMYFIIALSFVCRPCFLTHSWVTGVF